MSVGDVVDGLLAKKSISLLISLLIPATLAGVLISIPFLGPELSLLPPFLIGLLIAWGLGSAYGKRAVYRKAGSRN